MLVKLTLFYVVYDYSDSLMEVLREEMNSVQASGCTQAICQLLKRIGADSVVTKQVIEEAMELGVESKIQSVREAW